MVGVYLAASRLTSRLSPSWDQQVRQSTAPGASEFELEIVSEGRTFRFRTFNKPELSHWLTMLSKFAYTD